MIPTPSRQFPPKCFPWSWERGFYTTWELLTNTVTVSFCFLSRQSLSALSLDLLRVSMDWTVEMTSKMILQKWERNLSHSPNSTSKTLHTPHSVSSCCVSVSHRPATLHGGTGNTSAKKSTWSAMKSTSLVTSWWQTWNSMTDLIGWISSYSMLKRTQIQLEFPSLLYPAWVPRFFHGHGLNIGAHVWYWGVHRHIIEFR